MKTWLKKNLFSIVCLAIALCAVMLLTNQCQQNIDLKQEVQSVNSFLETEKQQAVNRDTIHAQEIRDMKQNLMSEISARELLKEEFERFKSIQSHIRTEFITRVDTLRIQMSPVDNILVNYDGFIPVDTVEQYFVQIPRSVNYADGWFKFNGTVKKDEFVIDSMSFINKFDVTVGYKKSDKSFAFLRKKVPTVELVSYNPYTKMNYVNNIVVENKKDNPFVSKPAMFGYGLAVGFLTGLQIK